METFIKVYIKSEEDLPKKDGEYIVSSGNDKAVEWFFRDNPYDISHWIEDIDWYLKPVEIPEITDEEVNVFVNSCPGNSGNLIIDKAVESGFKVGAKWYREELKKRMK